jgi:hypothetical protein
MNRLARQVFLAFAVAGIGAAPAPVWAQESLGDERADALVAMLQEKEPEATLTCTFVGEIVTCAGTKIGSCIDLGWQVNHSGGTCRKNVNE